jgi:hypothetical protein
VYDPGTAALDERGPWMGRVSPTALRRTRVRVLPRSELGEVRVERVGERQRLTVDVGAERIELGASLEEPEREWLADVLRGWLGKAR